MERMIRRCCTCCWHEHENIDDGYVCVNDKSSYCTEWTDDNFYCEKWEDRNDVHDQVQ
jgi:hypothetical protein